MQYIWKINYFFISLHKNIIKIMFKEYEKLYERYVKYLLEIDATVNISDMGGDGGFNCDDLFIANLYQKTFDIQIIGKYSEETERIMFITPSLNTFKKIEELKLIRRLSDYKYKEYSLIDTLKNFEHYEMFNGCVYILTDIGLIKIFYRESENCETIDKISWVKIHTDSEKNVEKLETFINDALVEIPQNKKQKNITVCTNGNYGIQTSKIDAKPFDCDLKKNYNDDLPYKQLNELITSENEELILLHGEPGTGKTSIIKKLIHDNPKTEFLYLDSNLLTSFSDSRVFSFLETHKNEVFILEDCEKLFTDRNNGNTFLNSMLNLTDGIIGEAFGIKFVCTFNCPPSKIDKAVMRKGRLSLMYEFKKLTLEKTKQLLPTATEPMTLADIYNQENNGNDNKNKKIGF